MDKTFQHRFQDMREQAEGGVDTAQEWIADMVEPRPITTLCTSFAAGLLTGVCVGVVLYERSRPRSRYSKLKDFEEEMTHRISDAVQSALPSSWR
ncbi:MAG: hypothetical protein KDA80_03685 [Planctomycetaceae bacterium]|nr:hypothetical protein [Planctomycetaceae bacterium]